MNILNCHFGDFQQTSNQRLVFKEAVRHKPKKDRSNHPSAARFKEVKKAYLEAKASTTAEDAEKRLEKTHDFQKALEQYPGQADFDKDLSEEQKLEKMKQNMIRAEVRKKVSKTMFEHDKSLKEPEQQEIKERQSNAYYEYEIKDKSVRGFVEAPHGIAPSEKVKAWCKEKGVTSHETHTAEITKMVPNWLVFKRSRMIADVNSYPKDKELESSLRSENSVYTKQDNLNALIAQRDTTKKILKEQNNLDENGQAKNPHLAIYLHGKADTRGHDFEIAAKEVDGKNLINPLVAFWIQEKLKEKIEQKGMRNSKGETPSVNVVTFPGAYSGSEALRSLRNGDGSFDFKGLGENFQALQLEVGAHIRKGYQKELADTMQELLKDFTHEFKTAEDVQKLEKDYQSVYEQKHAEEKEDFFSKVYVEFDDEKIDKESIGLSKGVLEVLKINIGDKVKIAGHELNVVELPPAIAKQGKRFLLSKEHENDLGDKLEFEVPGEKKSIEVDAELDITTGDQAAPHASDSHNESAQAEAKAEADANWKKITSGVKFFLGAARDKIKSWLGLGGGGHSSGH